MAQHSPDTSQLAKQFIDASIRDRTKPPSKAAYTRAIKLAREAMEDLAHVARRAGSDPTGSRVRS